MITTLKQTRIAGAMALAFSIAATSLSAAPVLQFQGQGAPIPTAAQAEGLSNLLNANHRTRRGEWCRNHPIRCDRLRDRRGDRDRFLNGHRGSKFRRHGHRRHSDGWWYPLAAFAFTAYLFDQHNRNHRYVDPYAGGGWSHIPRRNMAQHDAWCDWRYRSYSKRTKTFQPYHGPRKFCNSPYDRL